MSEKADLVNDTLIKEWEEGNNEAAAEHDARPKNEATEQPTEQLTTRQRQSPPPSEQLAEPSAAAASSSALPAAAAGGALKLPGAAANARGVRWADCEDGASTLEQVQFVDTEFGLPPGASEREKRAHLAGLERAKLRREAIAKGAGAVARKSEGKGHLCKKADALEIARELEREVAGMV